MKQAVIVSTARTALAKSVRGGFNQTHGAVMGGHAVKHAIAKAGIDPAEVEDVYMGCGMPEGATGNNIARESAIWAGCPVSTAGVTVNPAPIFSWTSRSRFLRAVLTTSSTIGAPTGTLLGAMLIQYW